jgi:hypothetical protein
MLEDTVSAMKSTYEAKFEVLTKKLDEETTARQNAEEELQQLKRLVT